MILFAFIVLWKIEEKYNTETALAWGLPLVIGFGLVDVFILNTLVK